MIQLRSKFDVAEALLLPVRVVDRLTRSGELPSVELTKSRRGYLDSDVDAFIESRRRAAQEAG